MRGRTSASLSCLTHRRRPSLRLTESLWTGCSASVVWRWDSVCALVEAVFIKLLFDAKATKCPLAFFFFYRPNGCWWRGWGRRAWNWVREKQTSQACRKTHSYSVCVTYWREPGATGCSWNRSDTQTCNLTCYQMTYKKENIWNCVSSCKQIHIMHMDGGERAQYWRVCLFWTGEVRSLVPSASLPGSTWEDRGTSWVSRSEHSPGCFVLFVQIMKLRVDRSLPCDCCLFRVWRFGAEDVWWRRSGAERVVDTRHEVIRANVTCI